MGMPPAETLGAWEGDTLRFQTQSEQGHSRYEYEITGPDSYQFRILGSRHGLEWSPIMDGQYRRVAQ